MKILIIEDEQELSNSICSYLSENYTCEVALEYYTALEKIHVYDYACIILDLTLPNGSGLELLKELKKLSKSEGVLIISAKNSLDDKVYGLKAGADDYLSKPFHLPELGARVDAIIRRKSFSGSDLLTFDDLVLDLSDKTLKKGETSIVLTKKEYELLVYFISNKNKVLSKDSIVEHLWGDGIDQADSYYFIYTHIKNLRKKLIQAAGVDYIKVVYGLGYKFSTANK